MNETKFWDIIDVAQRRSQAAVRGSIQPHDALNEALTSLLVELPIEEVVSFQGWFEYLLNYAHTSATLHAYALISDGTASEDGYLYFRTWLVGLGESMFRAVVGNPDVLADHLHDRINLIDQCENEDLRYASARACEEQTGLKDWDEGWPLDCKVIDQFVEAREAEPGGRSDFGQPAAKCDIPKRLPKLAAKCEELWSRDPHRPKNAFLAQTADGNFTVRYRQQGQDAPND